MVAGCFEVEKQVCMADTTTRNCVLAVLGVCAHAKQQVSMDVVCKAVLGVCAHAKQQVSMEVVCLY